MCLKIERSRRIKIVFKFKGGKFMKEKNFIKLYKKEKNLKNYEEAKREIDFFWSVLIEALKQDGKVMFKDWGKFEVKEVKSRKVKTPAKEGIFYTLPKKVMAFKCGNALRARINNEGGNNG